MHSSKQAVQLAPLLIVDDHPVLRAGLKRLLRAEGMTVCSEAHDAASAMVALQSCQPRVVVLDFSLPGTNGLALLRQPQLSTASDAAAA